MVTTKKATRKTRRRSPVPTVADVHETLHAVRLVADLLERAMGYRAARAVLGDRLLRASARRAMEALEALYQDLGRRLDGDESPSPESRGTPWRTKVVLSRADEVLGDASRAVAWLGRPNRALAGKKPQDLLGTDRGADEVLEVLSRIKYGVYE